MSKILYEGGIAKFVSLDHHLSSPCNPSDDK